MQRRFFSLQNPCIARLPVEGGRPRPQRHPNPCPAQDHVAHLAHARAAAPGDGRAPRPRATDNTEIHDREPRYCPARQEALGLRPTTNSQSPTMNAQAILLPLLTLVVLAPVRAADWATYEGKAGPGRGKHIVFLSGDEEYRSEEGLPMLARILARAPRLQLHGPLRHQTPPTARSPPPCSTTFRAGEAGDSGPVFYQAPLPRVAGRADEALRGLRELRQADHRAPDATHSFNYTKNKQSPYARYAFNSTDWPGGFGQPGARRNVGEHHGDHGKESTRGILNDAFKSHPILRA